MKIKSNRTGINILIMLILTSLLFSPICSSNTYTTYGEEYYFEDVNVLVIGRCRTIAFDGSDPLWTERLFIGTRSYVAAFASDTPLERMHVLIRNESTHETFFKLVNAGVHMFNASGVFYWGAKGFDVKKIPPLIIIMVNVENVCIRWFDVPPLKKEIKEMDF